MQGPTSPQNPNPMAHSASPSRPSPSAGLRNDRVALAARAKFASPDQLGTPRGGSRRILSAQNQGDLFLDASPSTQQHWREQTLAASPYPRATQQHIQRHAQARDQALAQLFQWISAFKGAGLRSTVGGAIVQVGRGSNGIPAAHICMVPTVGLKLSRSALKLDLSASQTQALLHASFEGEPLRALLKACEESGPTDPVVQRALTRALRHGVVLRGLLADIGGATSLVPKPANDVDSDLERLSRSAINAHMNTILDQTSTWQDALQTARSELQTHLKGLLEREESYLQAVTDLLTVLQNAAPDRVNEAIQQWRQGHRPASRWQAASRMVNALSRQIFAAYQNSSAGRPDRVMRSGLGDVGIRPSARKALIEELGRLQIAHQKKCQVLALYQQATKAPSTPQAPTTNPTPSPSVVATSPPKPKGSSRRHLDLSDEETAAHRRDSGPVRRAERKRQADDEGDDHASPARKRAR